MKVLVSGMLNYEANIKVESFPISYSPINFLFNNITLDPSGVGLNLAYSFNSLGDDVILSSIIGKDDLSSFLKDKIRQKKIDVNGVLPLADEICKSVVLYDNEGKRKIYCDLYNIQDLAYPTIVMNRQVLEADVLCLCNINYNRPFLKEYYGKKLIATDCHVVDSIYDEYNYDFMKYSDILFLSDERISNPEAFLEELSKEFPKKIIAISLGKKGVIFHDFELNKTFREKACEKFNVVNTVGAGDALFSSFVHFYTKGYSSIDAFRMASFYAAKKISSSGGAKGFICEEEVIENCK